MATARLPACFAGLRGNAAYRAVGNERRRVCRYGPGDSQARRIVVDEPRVNVRSETPVQPSRLSMGIARPAPADSERNYEENGGKAT